MKLTGRQVFSYRKCVGGTAVSARRGRRMGPAAAWIAAARAAFRSRLWLAAGLCLTLGLSLAACAGPTISEAEKPLTGNQWPEAHEQCKIQPTLDWCASMSSSEIKQLDRVSRSKFRYRPDGYIDSWRSHADQVASGKAWSGDCDDLSSTVLDILGRRGVPLQDRYRVLVSMSKNGKADHMIGLVVDNKGKFWVVGDTNQPIYPASAIYYQPIEYNRLSERVNGEPVWRRGFP